MTATPQTTQFQKRSLIGGGTASGADYSFANYAGTTFAQSPNTVLTTGNVITRGELEALTVPVFALNYGGTPTNTTRGGRFIFFGTPADGTAHSYQLLAAYRIPGQTDEDVQYAISVIVAGTFTMGAKTGRSTTGAVKTTDRFADQVTGTSSSTATTPKGLGAFNFANFSSAAVQVYSPDDATFAVLGVSDFGNPAFLIMDLAMGSGAGNCLFARDN